MAKEYYIPDEVVKALLSYLQERPYKEVAGGITYLTNLVPVGEKNNENNVDKKSA